MSVTELSVADLAAGIRAGELSPLAVLEAFIERIELLNPELNAVVATRFAEARSEAAAAERAVAAGGALPPLHGVPATVKEAIAVAGLPQTNGSLLTADVVAPRDARAVANLRAAGAVVMGVTNVPEFCGYYDTDNRVYGRTVNPHDHEHTSGGSSGGESAALSASLSPLGVGSDIGSSVRQPACWTGVYGMKPTRGLVPLAGHAGFGDAAGMADVRRDRPDDAVRGRSGARPGGAGRPAAGTGSPGSPGASRCSRTMGCSRWLGHAATRYGAQRPRWRTAVTTWSRPHRPHL